MPQDATNRTGPTQGAPGVWGESDRRGLNAELDRFDRHLVPVGLRPLIIPPAVPPEPLAA